MNTNELQKQLEAVRAELASAQNGLAFALDQMEQLLERWRQCEDKLKQAERERDEARASLSSVYVSGVALNGRILEAAFSDAGDARRRAHSQHERAERFLKERDAARVALRRVAERQRKACAEKVFTAMFLHSESFKHREFCDNVVAACADTPLVTEVGP